MIHEKTADSRRTSAINIRAFPSQRELIDRACREMNKNMTDFILEAACREAEHVLCDRRFFVLEEKAFDAFEAALDTPLKDNKAVQRLLAARSPWVEG
jgi:uncharacterized protein (DUF1778 family)